MKFTIALLFLITSPVHAQGLCSVNPKSSALELQTKKWYADNAAMRSEILKFGQEFQTAFAQPSFDAQTEEKFRARYEEMNKRHKELYSQANDIVHELNGAGKTNGKCKDQWQNEAENIRSIQSSLYNDLLEADPTVKAASKALSHHSS